MSAWTGCGHARAAQRAIKRQGITIIDPRVMGMNEEESIPAGFVRKLAWGYV
jgi:hypothetical protein